MRRENASIFAHCSIRLRDVNVRKIVQIHDYSGVTIRLRFLSYAGQVSLRRYKAL